MAATDVEGDGDDLGILAGLRGAYDPIYGPLVIAGALVQFAAVALQSVPMALGGLLAGAIADLATSDERNAIRGRLRRFGLGLLQRVTFRAIMVLGVLIPAGVPTSVLTGYVLGFLALGLSTRGIGFALNKVLRVTPATPELNLGEDLPLATYFPRLRRRRVLAIGILAGAELPLAAAVWLGAQGQEVAALAVIAGTVVVLGVGLAVAVRTAVKLLRSDALDRHERQLGDAIADTGARVVLYFSGDRESTYQLNQWLPVIDQLDRPVLILLRERGHLNRMLPTRHPVIVCRRHRDVEVALACDPLVVLYVGQAGRNIHFLRYGRPNHVFLNHGDSDKVSSASPVVKVYDRLFVAGEIAIDRYHAAGVDLEPERFVTIGRPQLDQVLDERRRLGDGPPTLLYAPTWEGYFEAADYSSLERSGLALIEHVLTRHPDIRVVFKPHPLSGAVRPGAKAALQAVEARLRAAGQPHVLADDHPELDLLAWFDRSDVLLSDISAVVTDYLATDKPYLVTNPRGLDLEEFRARFPSHDAAYVVDADLDNLDEQLTAAFGDDPMAEDRARMKRRVLGDLPDGALAAFSQAIDAELIQAERDAAKVVNTFSYDR